MVSLDSSPPAALNLDSPKLPLQSSTSLGGGAAAQPPTLDTEGFSVMSIVLMVLLLMGAVSSLRLLGEQLKATAEVRFDDNDHVLLASWLQRNLPRYVL